MTGILDGLDDPLAEVTEVARDAGLSDLGPLGEATEFIQDMLTERGIPPESYRFLHGPPQPGTEPTAFDDPEDYIAQAGHIVDNLTGGPAFGKLGAAVTNTWLSQEKPFERPGWRVMAINATEGLSELTRCELILERPEIFMVDTPATADAIEDLKNALDDFGQNPDGSYGFGATTSDVATIMNVVGRAMDPDNFLQDFSDKPDPDALDVPKILDAWQKRITGQPNLDPADFLGQHCRVCIARRYRQDMFTLTERWIGGIGVELEDLGYIQPTIRRIRLVIMPRLHVLSLRSRHRVFQGLNAVEIVLQILKEHGIYQGDGELELKKAGLKLLGPLGVPDAAAAALGTVGEAVNAVTGAFGAGSEAGDTLGELLESSVEDWCTKREHCVQYGETDLEFVERLLAEEGISYTFRYAERLETLVLAEDPMLAGKKTLTLDRRPLAVESNAPSAGDRLTAETCWSLEVDRAMVTSTTTLRDQCMTFARVPVDSLGGAQAPTMGEPGLGSIASMAADVLALGAEARDAPGTEDYGGDTSWFEYGELHFVPSGETPLAPDAAYDSYGGREIGKQMLEGMRARGAVARGSTIVTMLMPGNHIRMGRVDPAKAGGFDTLQKATGEAARFLVTRMTHRKPDGGAYINTFEGMSEHLRFRPPPRRRRPTISGLQTAIVLDSEQIDQPRATVAEPNVDKLYRVLVRFHWDRRTRPKEGEPAADEKACSCWVRVAQPLAGANWGAMLAPRVGMEAVVSFLDGNPDRPVVIGCLYNGAEAPNAVWPKRAEGEGNSFDHLSNCTQTILRTRSWPFPEGDDKRANELRFDDLAGYEGVYLHAQHDLDEKIGHDHVTTVVENQTNNVLGPQTEDVAGAQTLFVHAGPGEHGPFGRDKIVTGNEKVEIGVKGGTVIRDEVIGKNVALVVGDERTREVAMSEIVTVNGKGEPPPPAAGEPPPAEGAEPKKAAARELLIHGSAEVKVEGDDILRVGGDREVIAEGPYKVEAATVKKSTYDAGAPEPETPDDKNKVEFKPGEAAMESKGRVEVSGDLVTIRSKGDEVLVKAKTRITIACGENRIVLDGERGSLTLHADPLGGLVLKSGESEVVLRPNGVVLRSGASQLVVPPPPDENITDVADSMIESPQVTLDFKGQIHFNGAEVGLQRA